jgi:hypothetical protein
MHVSFSRVVMPSGDDNKLRMVGSLTLWGFVALLFLIWAMSEPTPSPVKPPIAGLGRIGLISVAHDRPDYYRQSLESIMLADRLDEVDLIVSLDDPRHYAELEKVGLEVTSKAGREKPIILHNPMAPFLKLVSNVDGRITAHHYSLLRRGFEDMGYDYLILIESDLVVSRDVIDYFLKVAPFLNGQSSEEDPLCASAWNDNGFEYFGLNETRLLRTDYFPGLGWMVHRSTWMNYWRTEWPHGLIGAWTPFDHWLRDTA